jgi:hypothetical protein
MERKRKEGSELKKSQAKKGARSAGMKDLATLR